jgi:branched-subunit amino acid permease
VWVHFSPPLIPFNTPHPNADKILHVCVPIVILLYTPGISAICLKRQKKLHRKKKRRNRGGVKVENWQEIN